MDHGIHKRRALISWSLLAALALIAIYLPACDANGDNPVEGTQELPPDPGEEGKQTLEGIDSDGDGLRDDVQRLIALQYSDDPVLSKWLYRYAKAETSALKNRESSSEEIRTATSCLFHLKTSEGRDALIEAYNAFEAVHNQIFNTKGRTDLYFNLSRNSDVDIYKLPDIEDLNGLCP